MPQGCSFGIAGRCTARTEAGQYLSQPRIACSYEGTAPEQQKPS
jgi:hypothetical protein